MLAWPGIDVRTTFRPDLQGAALPQTLATPLSLLLALAVLLGWLAHRRARRFQCEARRLEAQLRDLAGVVALRNQALERLHHQLKVQMESRLAFVNMVSHDLRTPITSIQLGVDRLRGMGEAGKADLLALLDREARRMETLLRGLQDPGAEGRAFSREAQVCHPGEILQGLTETFQLKAEARGLHPEVDLDPAADQAWVLVEVTHLQQVLFQLGENALQFTQAPAAVGIRSRVEAGAWVLDVWDQGRGIEPANLDLIFLPATRSGPGDGRVGLGLSLCKAIVEAHGGTLDVASEPGRGARFRVALPLIQ